MAKNIQLKDNNEEKLYPVSISDAIYMNDNKTLQETFDEFANDSVNYHARTAIVSGTIMDLIIAKMTDGYNGGDIDIHNYLPTDTFGGYNNATVHWIKGTNNIAHLFFHPHGSTNDIAIRTINNEESPVVDTGWRKINDGGNANTVGGKSASDFLLKDIPLVSDSDYNNFTTGIVYATSGNANKPVDYCIVTTKIASNGDGEQRAFHVSTRITYVRRRNNYGAWTAWADDRDGGNAYTLDGKLRTAFLQRFIAGTGIDLTSTTYQQPYIANIDPTKAASIGLPSNYWHLMYFPHAGDGYGFQVAYPLNDNGKSPLFRLALATTWQGWRSFSDGGNAATLGGKSASDFALAGHTHEAVGGSYVGTTAPSNTKLIWIDTSVGGVMKYYNGSAWVASKAVWG